MIVVLIICVLMLHLIKVSEFCLIEVTTALLQRVHCVAPIDIDDRELTSGNMPMRCRAKLRSLSPICVVRRDCILDVPC